MVQTFCWNTSFQSCFFAKHSFEHTLTSVASPPSRSRWSQNTVHSSPRCFFYRLERHTSNWSLWFVLRHTQNNMSSLTHVRKYHKENNPHENLGTGVVGAGRWRRHLTPPVAHQRFFCALKALVCYQGPVEGGASIFFGKKEVKHSPRAAQVPSSAISASNANKHTPRSIVTF